MYILAIDTTGPYCSAAIVDAACILAHKSENIGRGHAERLAPMVDEILIKARLKPDQIDRISVCVGPGSFTGIRVGLAFAKGFALPRNIPVIGIKALDVTAHRLSGSQSKHPIGIYRDIRRGEVYYGLYKNGAPLGQARTTSLEDAQAETRKLNGALYESKMPQAPILAWLAADRSPVDYPATPLYSRPPDAKLPGGLDLK